MQQIQYGLPIEKPEILNGLVIVLAQGENDKIYKLIVRETEMFKMISECFLVGETFPVPESTKCVEQYTI